MCAAEFVDDGEQLSDQEWSEFFQTQLDNIKREAAEAAEDSVKDDTDRDDPFDGLPDPFDDELTMPGVRLCSLAGFHTLALSSSNIIEPAFSSGPILCIGTIPVNWTYSQSLPTAVVGGDIHSVAHSFQQQ